MSTKDAVAAPLEVSVSPTKPYFDPGELHALPQCHTQTRCHTEWPCAFLLDPAIEPALRHVAVRVRVLGTGTDQKIPYLNGAWEQKVLDTVRPLQLCVIDCTHAARVTKTFRRETVDMPIRYLQVFPMDIKGKGKKVLAIRGATKGNWGQVCRVEGRVMQVRNPAGFQFMAAVEDLVVVIY